MTLRMVAAERLKLAKRRGVFWPTLALTVGGVLLVMLLPELFHLLRGNEVAPAGGERGMIRGTAGLAFVGSVAALIVGGVAGSGDLSAGVFRDLVATGRPRWSLFAAKIPGALVFFVPFVVAAYAIVVICSFAFRGHEVAQIFAPAQGEGIASTIVGRLQVMPTFATFAEGLGWVLLFTCFDLLLALGVSSIVTSRAATVGILLGFQFIVSPILLTISYLAGTRQSVFLAALYRLAPTAFGDNGQGFVPNSITGNSLATALLVLLAWIGVVLALGLRRTVVRDV
jgi:ABC-type transport system involved in multi-copper enzyme maturation permease subunit